MKNSILLLVFNYSNRLNNKQKICDLYKDHFKKIIVYSDIPKNDNEQLHEDVNYVDIHRGIFVYKIFKHFYSNYKNDIKECDGLFYTMDDNIINTNILHLYDTGKIIYNTETCSGTGTCSVTGSSFNIKPLDAFNGWQWDRKYGKNEISELEKNAEYHKFGINKYCGEFADYFYLPKKYLSSKIFDLFQLFANYGVFLEIAIPTIIRNIEPEPQNYNNISGTAVWEDRQSTYKPSNIKNKFNKEFDLFLHPVKFGQHPELFDLLNDIFQKKKCVIITTINEPTETIRKHISNSEYDVIIVGDLKTPNTYKNEDCIFLDVDNQKKLFPELCDLIPYNHYGRKNLGYLYAIKKGYEVIYETDDDNIPHDNFDVATNFDKNIKTIRDEGSEWINIFKFFTNNSWIWPRGYPLSNIKQNPHPDFKFDNSKNKEDVAIINGLVENDPDVDAIFRLVCNHSVKWEKDKKIIISNQNTCPFNTQNTFWVDPELFIGLLIPCSVTFRYCDILKGIIANTLLKSNNKNMAYTSPNVTQLRNEHDLMQDFESEVPMYLANETIVDELSKDVLPEQKCNKELMRNIYQKLYDKQIITEIDLKICETWLKYF